MGRGLPLENPRNAAVFVDYYPVSKVPEPGMVCGNAISKPPPGDMMAQSVASSMPFSNVRKFPR